MTLLLVGTVSFLLGLVLRHLTDFLIFSYKMHKGYRKVWLHNSTAYQVYKLKSKPDKFRYLFKKYVDRI